MEYDTSADLQPIAVLIIAAVTVVVVTEELVILAIQQ